MHGEEVSERQKWKETFSEQAQTPLILYVPIVPDEDQQTAKMVIVGWGEGQRGKLTLLSDFKYFWAFQFFRNFVPKLCLKCHHSLKA